MPRKAKTAPVEAETARKINVRMIMIETSSECKPQDYAQTVQIPAGLLKFVRSRRLTGTEYALWLYLYELAPSGSFTDIPSPHELAATLNVTSRTIERAARRLEDLNLFTFQIQSWRVRNAKVAAQNTSPIAPPFSTVDFSLGKEIQMPTERSICPENNQSPPPPETQQNQEFRDFSTFDFVPEQIGLNLKKETDLVETNTSVLINPFNKEGFGTTFDALCKYIKEHGFDPNPAIRATLTKLFTSLEPIDLQRRIDNAISAVQEQIAKGNLKRATPEPLLNAALQGRFTSNREKQKAKERRKAEPQASQAFQPPKTSPLASPTSSSLTSQIDLVQLSLSIDDALFKGDRTFAYEKLCRLWQIGLEEVVREILGLRRDWGFRLGLNGPEEVSSAAAPG